MFKPRVRTDFLETPRLYRTAAYANLVNKRHRDINSGLISQINKECKRVAPQVLTLMNLVTLVTFSYIYVPRGLFIVANDRTLLLRSKTSPKLVFELLSCKAREDEEAN